MIRSRLAASRACFVLALALSASALLAATAVSADSQEVLVGRYVGGTDQDRNMDLRVESKDGKLVLTSLQSSIGGRCPTGSISSNFGTRSDTVIGGDGRVEVNAGEGAVKVSIILRGESAIGRIDYTTAKCHFSSKFVAYLQPPEPVVTAGHYYFHGTGRVDLHVTQKRGYFELTDFSGQAVDCNGKEFGIDVEPEAFIEEDGHVEFTALGGRARVEVNFHHKVNVRGQIIYSHDGCTESELFAARLAPPL